MNTWPGDADRRAFIEHRTHQLHETMLDHAIWQRLLAQRVADGAYEAVWIDRWGQPQVVMIDHTFLEMHSKFLHALRRDLIAAGADAPVSLEGIFAPQRRGWPVDLPTLLTSAMETVATAQQVMVYATRMTEHAQRVCAQAATLRMRRPDAPGPGSSREAG